MGRAAAEPMQLLFPGLSSSTNLRDRFEIGRELGRGGGGVVHTCHSLVTGKPIAACKSIPKYKLQRREVLMELRNEIDTMLKLRGHPHIVELQGLYEDAGAVHLIMDLCEGGDLYEYLASNVTLPEKVAAMVVKQVLRALRHCHENGVVHRDVKPENILITKPVSQPPVSASSTLSSGSRSTSSSSGSPPEQPLPALHLKLADFGLAMRLRAGEKAMGMYGSSVYMAPEVVCRRGCSTPVDIWSLGVILYTALCGYMPFWGSTEEDLFLRILRNSPDFEVSPWPTISPSAIDLVRWMLSTDPAARPTSLEALNHPWVVTNTTDLRAASVNNIASKSNIMGTPIAPLPALVPVAAKGGSSGGAGASAKGASGVSMGEEPLPLAQTGSGRSSGSGRAREAEGRTASGSGSSGAVGGGGGESGRRSKKTKEDEGVGKAASSAMAVEVPEAMRQSAGSGLSNESSTADNSLSLAAAGQPGSASPSQAQGKAQGKAQAQVQEEAVNISERSDLGHPRGSKVVPVPGGEPGVAQAKASGAPAQGSAGAGAGAVSSSAGSAGAAVADATGLEMASGSAETPGALLGWGANLIAKSSPPAPAPELLQQQQQQRQGKPGVLGEQDVGVSAGGTEEGMEGSGSVSGTPGKLAKDSHRIPPVTVGLGGSVDDGGQGNAAGREMSSQVSTGGHTQAGGGVPEAGSAEQASAVPSQESVGSLQSASQGVPDGSEQPQVYQQVQPAGAPGRQPRAAAPRSASPFRFLRLSAYGRRSAHGPSEAQGDQAQGGGQGREGAGPGAGAQGQPGAQGQVTSPPTLSSRRFASPMRRGGGSPATKIFSGRFPRDQRPPGMPGAGPHSGELTPRAWQGPKGTGMTGSASASMVNSAANSPPESEAQAPDSPRRLLSFGSSGAGMQKLARSNTSDFNLPGRRGGAAEEGGEAARPASPRLRPLFSPMRQRRQNSSTSSNSHSGPVGRTSSSTSSERAPTLERRDSFSSSGLLSSFQRRVGGHSGGPFGGGALGVFAPARRTDSATEDPTGMRANAGVRRMGVPRSASADRAPANLPANLASWQQHAPVEPATSAAAAASLAASAKAGVPPMVYQRHPVVTHSLETAGGLVGGEDEGASNGPAPSVGGTPSEDQAALVGTQSKEADSVEAPAEEVLVAGAQSADKAQVEGLPVVPGAAQEVEGASKEEGVGAGAETSSQEQGSLPKDAGAIAQAATGGATVAAPAVTAGEERGVQVTPTKASVAAAPNTGTASNTTGAGPERVAPERAVRAPVAHKFQDEMRPRERAVGPVGAGGSPGNAPFVAGTAQPRRAPERAPAPGRSPGLGAQKRSPGVHSRPDGVPFTIPAGVGGGVQRASAGAPQQVPWGGAGRREVPRGGPGARPGAAPAAASGLGRAAEVPAARASPSQAFPTSSAEIQAELPTGSASPGAASVIPTVTPSGTPTGTPGARVAPAARVVPAAARVTSPRASGSGTGSGSGSARQTNGEASGKFPGGRSDSWGESGGRVGQREAVSPGVYHRTGGAPPEGQGRPAAGTGASDRFSDRYTPEKSGVDGVYKKLQESPPTLDRVMSRGLVQGVPLASPFQRTGSSKSYGRVTSMNAPSMGGQRGNGAGMGPGMSPGPVPGGVPPGPPSPAKGNAPVGARPPSPLRERIIRFASPGRMRGSSSPSRRSES